MPSPASRPGFVVCASRYRRAARRLLNLLGDAQLRQVRPDLVERRDDRARRREQEELARVARALLQQRGRRVAAGIDLDRIEDDASRLDFGAGDALPLVDRALVL